MDYKVNGVVITSEIFNSYVDTLVNKVFALLGIYEDCSKINNYESYLSYLDRVLIEISGGYEVIGGDAFLSLTNILNGMRMPEELSHKQIKSLVFHCISMIKKSKWKDAKV